MFVSYVKISRNILILLTVIVICSCHRLVYPNYDNLYRVEGDSCSIDRSTDGICLRKCIPAEEDFYERGTVPKICSWYNSNVPLLCCPVSSISNFISSKPPSLPSRPIEQSSPSRPPPTPLPPSQRPIQQSEPTTTENSLDNKISPDRISVEQCKKYLEFFIAGGTQVEIYDYPHMSVLGWSQPGGGFDFKCGGSLISKTWVVTAAHCLQGPPPDVVRVGDIELSDSETPKLNYSVIRVVRHPEYKASSYYNDIALLKLNETLPLMPACLWQKGLTKPSVIATGFGHVEFGGQSSDKLLKVDLQVYDNSECDKVYGISSHLSQGMLNTQLCVGDAGGKKDTCQGDSGGPLQIDIGVMDWSIVGITSFGGACATGVPAVYTRVSEYLDWIESIVWAEGEERF